MAVHRRLAAADLEIAPCLRHRAPAILCIPRGADDAPPPACQSGVAHHIATTRKSQLILAMIAPTARYQTWIRRFLGFPCRFPATPAIRLWSRTQVFDQKRPFDSDAVTKKIFP